MASVKNGLSENIKGRLGNVIFYSRLGRTYARLRPPKGHDPCTVLQQQQRSRMKDVTLFYKVVRQSPLAGIWRQAGGNSRQTAENKRRHIRCHKECRIRRADRARDNPCSHAAHR